MTIVIAAHRIRSRLTRRLRRRTRSRSTTWSGPLLAWCRVERQPRRRDERDERDTTTHKLQESEERS
jgi:hypothetical protein